MHFLLRRITSEIQIASTMVEATFLKERAAKNTIGFQLTLIAYDQAPLKSCAPGAGG
jgi:hypothetical protein